MKLFAVLVTLAIVVGCASAHREKFPPELAKLYLAGEWIKVPDPEPYTEIAYMTLRCGARVIKKDSGFKYRALLFTDNHEEHPNRLQHGFGVFIHLRDGKPFYLDENAWGYDRVEALDQYHPAFAKCAEQARKLPPEIQALFHGFHGIR